MNKYKNKYRIESARAQWWDYSWNAAYFVTICTHGKQHYFGSISEQQLRPSQAGKLAERIWPLMSDQFDFVYLDAFVVMPNHVHGIVVLHGKEEDSVEKCENSKDTTNKLVPENQIGGFAGQKNPMLHKSLGRVIRWYKGRCTFEIRKHNPSFDWQERYHDHIIRNEKSYQNIRNYIINNPNNWDQDTFFGP